MSAMSALGRWRRSVGARGVAGTLLHLPVAALRPLGLAVLTRRSAARAPAIIAAADPCVLNLGCGPQRLPDCVNVDLYFPAELRLDLTRPLPIPEASVDAICSQHFIEHISREAGERLIAECVRVLRPGGWLRMSTPDLEWMVRCYLEDAEAGDESAADALNERMRAHDHLHIYDFAGLAGLFTRMGLTDVHRAPPQESECPWLCGRESRLAAADADEIARHLIVEGRKSG